MNTMIRGLFAVALLILVPQAVKVTDNQVLPLPYVCPTGWFQQQVVDDDGEGHAYIVMACESDGDDQ